ncbi:hypothetical protein F4780DRAFT_737160 [Xylariomycetidae sp. FL0641]|nr:hypothetical protein F4780DRAFT_737160 [Xylariomycetidae sp. FL0641]
MATTDLLWFLLPIFALGLAALVAAVFTLCTSGHESYSEEKADSRQPRLRHSTEATAVTTASSRDRKTPSYHRPGYKQTGSREESSEMSTVKGDKNKSPGFFAGLKGRRSARSPFNPNYTIDTIYNVPEEENPLGYHSNALIATIRLLQFVGGLTIIGFGASQATSPQPDHPEVVALGIGLSSYSAVPCIHAVVFLWYRHVWRMWIAALECFWLIGWFAAYALTGRMITEKRAIIREFIAFNILLWAITVILFAVCPIVIGFHVKINNPSAEPEAHFGPKTRPLEPDEKENGNNASNWGHVSTQQGVRQIQPQVTTMGSHQDHRKPLSREERKAGKSTKSRLQPGPMGPQPGPMGPQPGPMGPQPGRMGA